MARGTGPQGLQAPQAAGTAGQPSTQHGQPHREHRPSRGCPANQSGSRSKPGQGWGRAPPSRPAAGAPANVGAGACKGCCKSGLGAPLPVACLLTRAPALISIVSTPPLQQVHPRIGCLPPACLSCLAPETLVQSRASPSRSQQQDSKAGVVQEWQAIRQSGRIGGGGRTCRWAGWVGSRRPAGGGGWRAAAQSAHGCGQSLPALTSRVVGAQRPELRERLGPRGRSSQLGWCLKVKLWHAPLPLRCRPVLLLPLLPSFPSHILAQPHPGPTTSSPLSRCWTRRQRRGEPQSVPP